MDEYDVYKIKEEFAYHYYQKGDILYRFIKNCQKEKNSLDLQKQFAYITSTFCTSEILKHIKNLPHNVYQVKQNGNYLEIITNKQNISLHIGRKHLNFRCELLHDAEILLFPILRIYHPYLFIVGKEINNYGWISPVIKKSKQAANQGLYSFH